MHTAILTSVLEDRELTSGSFVSVQLGQRLGISSGLRIVLDQAVGAIHTNRKTYLVDFLQGP
jgi:hypothetical protein